MKVIIQGFGSKAFLFEDFIKYFDSVYILNNNTNSYEEVENQLNDLYKNKEKFDILGWSLGSLYGLNYALNYKNRVKSLFLIGATARFTEKENYPNGIKLEMVKKMLFLIKRKELVMRDFYNNIFKFVEKKDKIIEKLIKELPDESVLKNGLNDLIEYDLIDRIKEIEIPVFICHGINDIITPEYGTIVIKKNIKNCELKLVDGGHSYFLEKPEECAKLWKEFLIKI